MQADGGAFHSVALLAPTPPTCLTLDFEHADDLVSPLANGQHLDTEFGHRLFLSSSGPNAGLAVFDSTPGGPNDPSQDPDLLVDTGNVLVLQTENLPPAGVDTFPRPNDDEDGGTVVFEFAEPIEAESLRLVDLDASDGTTVVALTDSSHRTRTYLVPGNWTGDRTLAQPGHALLDLTVLAPQPGFGSTATAFQDAGFAQADVRRIEVHLQGSGALDDLSYCTASPVWRSRARR